MADYYYDEDTDTYYEITDHGFEWLGFFIVMSTPAFILSVWLKEYARFVEKYPVLISAIFLVISVIRAMMLYRKDPKRKVKYRLSGMVAVIIMMLPIALMQAVLGLPIAASEDGAVAIAISWLFLTFITVSVTFFLNQIGLLLKNGRKHLVIAIVYISLIIALVLRIRI